MDLKDRLLEYRKDHLKLEKQSEMADRLGISRQLYSNVENGKNPSKDFIKKLVKDSNLPEEYWLYGINADDYIASRQEFKCLVEALSTLSDGTLLDLDENDKWDPQVERMLLYALKADITAIRLKNKKR